MLRVLTLSTLFPNASQPHFGGFVERQTLALASLAEVAVEVVAPIAMPSWPLSLHPRYRGLAGLPRREEWKGLTVHRPRFPILPLIGSAVNARLLARALEPRLREIRESFPFDVIDAEFFWPDGPAAMHLSAAFGVPFSIKARGSDIQYWIGRPSAARQILSAAEAADGLLAVSDALADVMVSHGISRDRIRTHYTGVDRSRFRPGDRPQAKRKLGLSGPLILTPGTLIPGKGQRIAIEALAEIPQATLFLAGEGPDRFRLEELVRRHPAGKRVRLLGSIDHSELAFLMAVADVMLLPSSSEGLANVWVEALASGTPVVTCDVGGAREVIRTPQAGALVPRDPAAIADAVKAILANPPLQSDVVKAAEPFSWERNSAALLDHLCRIVGR